MDKSKNPGISIASVHLFQCSVGDLNSKSELKFSLGITHFKREVLSEGKLLSIVVGFDLMQGIDNPPCKFDFVFGASYLRSEESNMTWDDFQDHVAVAHIIPYVREFVSNITTRLPLSVLMVPPVNTSKLLAEFRERSAAAPSAVVASTVTG